MLGSPDTPRVAVGIVTAGDNELNSCLDALQRQVGVDMRFALYGNFPQDQAAWNLFSFLDSMRGWADFTVKLDADMVVKAPNLLVSIANTFRAHRELDELTLGIRDWFSGEEIDGLHAYSGRVRWLGRSPRLQGDAMPSTAHRKVRVFGQATDVVLHGGDPSSVQSLRYGGYRTVRAMANGVGNPRWDLVRALVDKQIKEPHIQRGLAVAAVGETLRGHLLRDFLSPALDLSRAQQLADELAEVASDSQYAQDLQADLLDEALVARACLVIQGRESYFRNQSTWLSLRIHAGRLLQSVRNSASTQDVKDRDVARTLLAELNR